MSRGGQTGCEADCECPLYSAKYEKSHITHNTKENGGINDKRGKHTQNWGKI